MKKIYLLFLPLLAVILLILPGCENDYPDSIYDAGYSGNTTPIISSVSPANVGYAAVQELTINGSNFSTVPEDNYLYFNSKKVTVTSATATQLKFMAPNLESDSINIKVAVKGSILFSNIISKYKLLPAFIEFGGYTKLDDPYGLESDASGNLYVGLSLGTTGKIEKITPDGVKSDYGTYTFGIANSMKFGPDGSLYLTRLIPLIYRIPSGGGAASVYVTLTNAGKAADIDFDSDGNMWAVGNNSFVYKVKSDKSIKTFAFVANLKAVKIYDGYLYVAGKGSDSKDKVWRAQIKSNDELGAFEVYFDYSAKYSSSITSITFGSDAVLYIGNDGVDAETIIAVASDKTASALYSEFLKQKSYYITWGGGASSKYLFVSRRNDEPSLRKIMKIFMNKDGAPYYGRK